LPPAPPRSASPLADDVDGPNLAAQRSPKGTSHRAFSSGFRAATITWRADQVVSGTAINLLFLGIPALLSGVLFASTGATPQLARDQVLPDLRFFDPLHSPILASIFNQKPLVYLAFLLIVFTSYLLGRTRFGLRLRAVGENPEAADTAGISVARVRYVALLISGALAGLGGAYLSIGQNSLFTRNMTAGRGFIALLEAFRATGGTAPGRVFDGRSAPGSFPHLPHDDPRAVFPRVAVLAQRAP
jgi:ABC-type uncharacterized transport system permease subunit